jgi:dihydrofolate synthase / folylpolyglutamate synthase
VVDRRVALGGQLLTLRVGDRTIDEVLLPLFGAHQAGNAALALGAFAALTGRSFDAMEDDVIRHGLGAVTVPGRLEIVHREPTVVLDGAHNPHGARTAAAALRESFDFRDLILVVACLEGKDLAGILGGFREQASHVIVTRAPSPRGASLEAMRATALEVWGGRGPVVEVADDLGTALELAEGMVRDGDGILVTGSLHTVGAARDHYLPLTDPASWQLGDGRSGADAADEVVRGPDDERELDEVDVAELEELLADDAAFEEAIEQLLDEPPGDDR